MSRYHAVLIKPFLFLDIAGHEQTLPAQTPIEVYQYPYWDDEIEAGTFLAVCPGIDICILPSEFLLV